MLGLLEDEIKGVEVGFEVVLFLVEDVQLFVQNQKEQENQVQREAEKLDSIEQLVFPVQRLPDDSFALANNLVQSGDWLPVVAQVERTLHEHSFFDEGVYVGIEYLELHQGLLDGVVLLQLDGNLEDAFKSVLDHDLKLSFLQVLHLDVVFRLQLLQIYQLFLPHRFPVEC